MANHLLFRVFLFKISFCRHCSCSSMATTVLLGSLILNLSFSRLFVNAAVIIITILVVIFIYYFVVVVVYLLDCQRLPSTEGNRM